MCLDCYPRVITEVTAMTKGLLACLVALLCGAIWAQSTDSALRPWSVRLSV